MITEEELKNLITNSLKIQGFLVQENRITLPADFDKGKLRQLHSHAVRHRVMERRKGLHKHESKLLNCIASGNEVIPDKIIPRLVEVTSDSQDELLFRYASLHWSVPVSSGYGRRLRFLVVDEQNEKLIGIFGLGDPIFSLAPRDNWIGWDSKSHKERLHHVMDAFVLGAVPPYASLLCGKLVATLAASNEVREAFSRKYAASESIISRRRLGGQLALITTASALGRSSIYNRLRIDGRSLYESVGYTSGSGEFHFSNGLYSAISDYVANNFTPTAKHERWGKGFRSRREVVRKCLSGLRLSEDWLYHGVKREMFVVPSAHNTKAFLRGEESQLAFYDQPAEWLFDWFRERWLLPRAMRDRSYLGFRPSTYRLWDVQSPKKGFR